MPKVRQNRKCKYCENNAKLNIINGRNKGFHKTCGSEKCLTEQYRSKKVCLSKGKKGELHNRWIKDRSLVKQKRMITEEKHFFKEIIQERNFKCELTGLNNRLSVHHINGVWSHPDLRFDKNNCIVILNSIHKKFHKIYGNRTNEADWREFIENKEYINCYNINFKRSYSPFVDRTNFRYGRLLVLKKENKKWLCQCDCGNKTLVSGSNFKKTKSCGCYKREIDKLRFKNFHLNKKNNTNALQLLH